MSYDIVIQAGILMNVIKYMCDTILVEQGGCNSFLWPMDGKNTQSCRHDRLVFLVFGLN